MLHNASKCTISKNMPKFFWEKGCASFPYPPLERGIPPPQAHLRHSSAFISGYGPSCKSVVTIFYLCCLRCVNTPLTSVINYVFCIKRPTQNVVCHDLHSQSLDWFKSLSLLNQSLKADSNNITYNQEPHKWTSTTIQENYQHIHIIINKRSL